MSGFKTEKEEGIASETRDKLQEPPMYKVLLLNDDYTTMDFVVQILISVFNKSVEDATRITLNVHRKGFGVCGVYAYEVAETKIETVHVLARGSEFPLKCVMEKD
jgi:ATP-dependent Clp protease adaptor protein ClpS